MMQDRSSRPMPGKLLGVCQRAAADVGVPATALRVIAVLALLVAFKLTVAAYCVAALIYRLERR